MKNCKSFEIVIPEELEPKPDPYELEVAKLCTKFFQSDVEFVCRGTQTTPDIIVANTHQRWEIKNIRGNGKRTISGNLRKASKQSPYIIVSLLKPTKMTAQQAIYRVRDFLEKKSNIKQVLLLTKDKMILDVTKKPC